MGSPEEDKIVVEYTTSTSTGSDSGSDSDDGKATTRLTTRHVICESSVTSLSERLAVSPLTEVYYIGEKDEDDPFSPGGIGRITGTVGAKIVWDYNLDDDNEYHMEPDELSEVKPEPPQEDNGEEESEAKHDEDDSDDDCEAILPDEPIMSFTKGDFVRYIGSVDGLKYDQGVVIDTTSGDFEVAFGGSVRKCASDEIELVEDNEIMQRDPLPKNEKFYKKEIVPNGNPDDKAFEKITNRETKYFEEMRIKEGKSDTKNPDGSGQETVEAKEQLQKFTEQAEQQQNENKHTWSRNYKNF